MADSSQTDAIKTYDDRPLAEEICQRFSNEELEKIASADVLAYINKDPRSKKGSGSEPPLKSVFNEIALNLATTFETGRNHAAKDLRKAYALRQLAPNKPPKLHATKAEEDAWNEEQERLKNKWSGTNAVYWLLSTFNITRLAAVRTNRIYIGLGRAPILPAAFALLSASFWLEILFELGVVVKSVFEKPTEEEKHLSLGQRFKKIFYKDKRPARVFNAVIWATINTACLTIGIAYFAILNAIGFAIDVGYEIFSINNIRNRYNSIDNKLKLLLKVNVGNPEKVEALLHLREALKQKRKWELISQTYQTAIIAAVFVGMLFIYFGGFPSAFLFGSMIALVVGSLLGGIGKRIWLEFLWPKLKSYFPALGLPFEMKFKPLSHQPNIAPRTTAKPTTTQSIIHAIHQAAEATPIKLTPNKGKGVETTTSADTIATPAQVTTVATIVSTLDPAITPPLSASTIAKPAAEATDTTQPAATHLVASTKKVQRGFMEEYESELSALPPITTTLSSSSRTSTPVHKGRSKTLPTSDTPPLLTPSPVEGSEDESSATSPSPIALRALLQRRHTAPHLSVFLGHTNSRHQASENTFKPLLITK